MTVLRASRQCLLVAFFTTLFLYVNSAPAVLRVTLKPRSDPPRRSTWWTMNDLGPDNLSETTPPPPRMAFLHYETGSGSFADIPAAPQMDTHQQNTEPTGMQSQMNRFRAVNVPRQPRQPRHRGPAPAPPVPAPPNRPASHHSGGSGSNHPAPQFVAGPSVPRNPSAPQHNQGYIAPEQTARWPAVRSGNLPPLHELFPSRSPTPRPNTPPNTPPMSTRQSGKGKAKAKGPRRPASRSPGSPGPSTAQHHQGTMVPAQIHINPPGQHGGGSGSNHPLQFGAGPSVPQHPSALHHPPGTMAPEQMQIYAPNNYDGNASGLYGPSVPHNPPAPHAPQHHKGAMTPAQMHVNPASHHSSGSGSNHPQQSAPSRSQSPRPNSPSKSTRQARKGKTKAKGVKRTERPASKSPGSPGPSSKKVKH